MSKRPEALIDDNTARYVGSTAIAEGGLALTTDPLVRFSRPSIDVTFISAADTYEGATIGVVLTGANDDGARGLRRIVDRGGRAVVQDPASAESPVMPLAAKRNFSTNASQPVSGDLASAGEPAKANKTTATP